MIALDSDDRARRARFRRLLEIIIAMLGWLAILAALACAIGVLAHCGSSLEQLELDTARARACAARYEHAETMAEVEAVELACDGGGVP